LGIENPVHPVDHIFSKKGVQDLGGHGLLRSVH
jgi:hypothetical protein